MCVQRFLEKWLFTLRLGILAGSKNLLFDRSIRRRGNRIIDSND